MIAMLALVKAAAAQPSEGERAFQRCYACHSVVAGENKLTGPNLRGVVGRRAGALKGFDYSPAMVKAGRERSLIWTRETLDALMADADALVPGTSMAAPPLKDARERAKIIDYLETKR